MIDGIDGFALRQALIADEIGLETGIFGNYRLKSAFQPIYRREGALLVACSVEAQLAPFAGHRPAAPARLFAEAGEGLRAYLEMLCTTLHLHNYWHAGFDELEMYPLHIAVGPQFGGHNDAERAAGLVAEICDEAGLAPEMLICGIDAGEADAGAGRTFAGALHRHGIAVSMGFRTADGPSFEALAETGPDFVRIDGAWLRAVRNGGAAARLLAVAIRALGGFGTRLLVQGIEGPAELDAALEAGAAYCQGSHLHVPRPAGAILDERPLSVALLLEDTSRPAQER
ncbi:EAL domain-containing protein [Mesorhizobium xinjiangense]|uniref:EAL domain-containing protein n=1 Tax=Mesorhizobium xinjiangense TaxID=2678685 RepID=UPI0012EE15AB|nr:EAL domain-containing protein [Mesorhizobium xinjiangense]